MKSRIDNQSPKPPRCGLSGPAHSLTAVRFLSSFAIAAALVCSSFKGFAQAGPQQAVQDRSSVSLVVRLDGELTGSRAAQLKALGADIYRRLPLIRSVALRLPASNQARLERLPFVLHTSPDSTVKKSDAFTVGSSMAGVAYAQYNLTGNGVGVAIVDSGVNPLHPDLWVQGSLKSRVAASVSFVADGHGANDVCGHGTHVAGIVAGNGAMSSGRFFTQTFYGIARKANIINVRVLDGTGQSSVSTVVAGIQWVVNNAPAYNIRVLNLSLGHPVGESYTTDPLCQAAEAAWNAGIVVVCAAGNGGRLNSMQSPGQDNEGWGAAWGSIQSPANDPRVITVGAMKSMDGNRADDRIATYSSRGPSRLNMVMKPDIVAPGNQVISLESWNGYLASAFSGTNLIPWQLYCSLPIPGNSLAYFRLSGTSMSSPVVAGAAAMMLESNPSLNPDTIKARLMISADKWADPSGQYNPCTYGAGYLNILAALQCTAVANGPALSPSLYRDASGAVRVNESLIIWGNNVIWGLSSLPPGQPSSDLIIWGNNILWGSNQVSASNVLWGANVWASNVIWGLSAAGVDLSSTAVNGE